MSRSIDQVIAEQAERAGLDLNAAPERRSRDIGPIVIRGKTIAPLRDLVAVRLRAGLGMIGGLYVPDATLSTRNQTFTRATVISRGPKAEDALVGCTVIVSEYFGDEVHLRDDNREGVLHAEGNKVKLRIGRERDIVAIETNGVLFAIGDRLLMERIDAPKMAGNLYLPEDRNELQFRARVSSVGSKCAVKAGDTVIVKKDTCVCVPLDGREWWWVDEGALLGVEHG